MTGPRGFSHENMDTDVLAFKLANEIERVMGARPFLVVAHFHRKYIDANRPAAGAYESEAAKPHYDAYHDALRDACGDVRGRWGSGILIDIHGQGIDGIQLEFGRDLRRADAIDATAKDVAGAIAAFAKAFLPMVPLRAGHGI